MLAVLNSRKSFSSNTRGICMTETCGCVAFRKSVFQNVKRLSVEAGNE